MMVGSVGGRTKVHAEKAEGRERAIIDGQQQQERMTGRARAVHDLKPTGRPMQASAMAKQAPHGRVHWWDACRVR